MAILVPLWWLLDRDISRSAWLKEHVQSQTHYREGDEKREIVRVQQEQREGESVEGKEVKV